MSEPTQEEVMSAVSSIFDVSAMGRTLDTLHFKIEDDEFKSKFVDLAQKLERRDLFCKLEQLRDGRYVIVRKFPQRKKSWWKSSSWTPRILFAVVVVFVMVDGYYRTENANVIFDIGDPLEMAGIYTLALLGILGIHESGHLIAKIAQTKNNLAILYSRNSGVWYSNIWCIHSSKRTYNQ